MSKKLNLIYEWIGPHGPLTNNRIPTLVDLTENFLEDIHLTQYKVKHDLIQLPHFHTRFKDVVIRPSFNLPEGTFLYELNFNNFHYRDIHRAFDFSDGLLENGKINSKVWDKIVHEKQGYFLITLLYEGYLQDKLLMAMTEYFIHKKVPLSQIIYVSNCYNGKEIYNSFCTRNNLTPEMKMEYLPVFRVDKTDIEFILKNTQKYTPGKKEKLFLCFNRRYNEHRILLYTVMSKLNLIDRCFYSMSKIQPESTNTYITNVSHITSRYPILGISKSDIDIADSRLPLILDTQNFSRYPMESSINSVKHFYENSLINIVMETYFFNNIIHITEKTFKPIAFMQPFIMVAAPHSLQHVKDMGFKTFSDFWDESYDLELDHESRFLKIMTLLRNISTWSDEKQIQFSNDVKSILEFNYHHLRTMHDKELDEFTENYGC